MFLLVIVWVQHWIVQETILLLEEGSPGLVKEKLFNQESNPVIDLNADLMDRHDINNTFNTFHESITSSYWCGIMSVLAALYLAGIREVNTLPCCILWFFHMACMACNVITYIAELVSLY